MHPRPLILGAVAYAPKVVTIWEGFKAWFTAQGLPFDFVLFSNYESQVEAQFDGGIDLAWNSPLAWERARRIAASRGLNIDAVAMRDTDCDLRSVFVVRAGDAIASLADLRGHTLGVGAMDSPQATLIPLDHLRQRDLVGGRDLRV